MTSFQMVDGISRNLVAIGMLTHWGRVTHNGSVTIIGSDNGFLPGQRQAIIWTSAGMLLIQNVGTNFSEHIQENAFEIVICGMAANFF